LASRSFYKTECPNILTAARRARQDEIEEVVVDKKVLAAFKRRALKAFPNEYIETIWGYIRGSTAYIVVFHAMEHEGKKDRILVEDGYEHSEDEVFHDKLQLLGTIHTHPGTDSIPFPSETDWDTHQDEQEHLMGILAINKRGQRRFTSVNFFGSTKTPVALTIAE
jgi:proteasome lid subunit RPN8/RPN11